MKVQGWSDFAVHFRSKVDAMQYVRLLYHYTLHPLRLLADNAPARHSILREETIDEIAKNIRLAPAKHCQLDPAPTSLLKRLLPLLAHSFADMVCEN